MTIKLSTLATRFNDYLTLEGDPPDSFAVHYKDNGSIGGRYVSWHGVWAKTEVTESDMVIDKDRLYKEVSSAGCEWRHFFVGVHHGLIVGPKSLVAIEECLEILRNDDPPEDDGTKVRHINHLGGVNNISKPTLHNWDLTSRLGKILSSAFFEDRIDKTLYSEDFIYTYKSHSGWNRSC